MDWYVAWVKTQQELSEASKADHYWKTLPTDLRSRMSATLYREKRAAALTRRRQADAACRDMMRARQQKQGRFVPALGPASDPGNILYA